MFCFSFQMPSIFHREATSRQETQYGLANQPTPPGRASLLIPPCLANQPILAGLDSLLTPSGLANQPTLPGLGSQTNQHGLDSPGSLQLLGGLDLHHKLALMVLLIKFQ